MVYSNYFFYFGITLLAYLTVLLQTNVLSLGIIFGGQPNLIALLSVLFIITRRINVGIWWIFIGEGLIDLLLPTRFGFSLLPTLLGYGLIFMLFRYVINSPSPIIIIITGLLMVIAAESMLVASNQAWPQLINDLGASLIIITIVMILGRFLPTQANWQLRENN